MVTEETVICWSRDGALARIGIHRPDKRTALATANALKRSNKRPRDEAATASSAGTTEISQ